jgi:general stress protein YciG
MAATIPGGLSSAGGVIPQEAIMPTSQSDQGQTQGKSHRGFAAMDADKQREIARKGGESQGKENNPGNFANDRAKASAAGRKGGQSRGKSS